MKRKFRRKERSRSRSTRGNGGGTRIRLLTRIILFKGALTIKTRFSTGLLYLTSSKKRKIKLTKAFRHWFVLRFRLCAARIQTRKISMVAITPTIWMAFKLKIISRDTLMLMVTKFWVQVGFSLGTLIRLVTQINWGHKGKKSGWNRKVDRTKTTWIFSKNLGTTFTIG